MKAAFITGPGQVDVRLVDEPELEGGDIIVRVHSCGICGSDLHAYRGEMPYQANVPRGHEISGEVAVVAPGVEGVAPGDRVALAATTGCGSCSYCRTGKHQLCSRRRFLGLTYAGGMADLVRVPAEAACHLPDGLDWEMAALAEPLAVPVHGLHLAGVSIGERVLVMGCGSLGLLAILAARAMGAGEVISTYRYPHQRDAALAIGADYAYQADDEGIDAIAREAAKRPIDIVVETVGGDAPTLSQALRLARPGGRISLLGLSSKPKEINVFAMAMKETSIFSSLGYCQPGLRSDMEMAIQILAREAKTASRVISHNFGLADAAEAFLTASDKSKGSIKVIVSP